LLRRDEPRRLHRGTERRVRLDRDGSELGAEYFKAFYAQFDTAVTVLGGDALERVAALREEPGREIWLWGGGETLGGLAEASLVDTVEVGVIPVLLGAGRKVMTGCSRRVKLVQRPTELQLPGHTILVYDVEKRRRALPD